MMPFFRGSWQCSNGCLSYDNIVSGMPTVVIMCKKDGELLVVDVDNGSGRIEAAASKRRANNNVLQMGEGELQQDMS